MSRIIFCKRLKENLPGLAAPPFPGPRGQEIFESISEQAWQEWQRLQTMLINEKHLNMLDKEARQYLNEQRDKFLNDEAVEQAEGYTPPAPQNDKESL